MAKGNFIEYVVSDDPNKYPIDGEQNGYYYKRVITETEEKTVTPTTEDLIVTPAEGKNLSKVTVQGDANFLEENIAEGITIWGKTGTHICSGQYAWKKSKYIPETSIENAQMSISSTQYVKNLQITSASFDLDILTPENYKTLLLELFTSSDGTNYFALNDDSSLFVRLKSPEIETSATISGYDPTNHTLLTVMMLTTSTFNFSNNRTVTYKASKGNFVDFIVSDSETAYPNSSELDGYWYEKV